jgi:CRISPR-associated protein Csd1
MIEPQVFETQDAAYNCGRLLAVLAATQEKAHDFQLEGAGVVERYFSSASVSPSSALPLLLRLNRHHLEKIRKSENGKRIADGIEKDIQNIMTNFVAPGPGQPPEFPRYLNLKQQGRFAIGFYQQKAGTWERIQKAVQGKKQKESNTKEVSE